MRAGAVLVAAALVAGCAGSGSREPFRYYVLDAPAAAPGAPGAASAAASEATLLVLPTVAASFYATQEIAYSKAEGVRAYYQFSSWTEPPDVAVTRMLVARIDDARVFRSVAVAGRGMRGSLVLATELLEIYHDASTSPGTAKIVLAAELRDPAKRTMVARRAFSASVPASTFDAAGAVQGFRIGLGQIGDELTGWLASVVPTAK
jgi:cholesterol transport system auxiliary component